MEYSIYKSIKAFTNKWWISLVLGILLILTGIWIFRTPLQSYVSLSILFSIAIFVTGLVEISFSILNRKNIEGWGWYLVGGILDMLIGTLLLTHPLLTMMILPYYVAFWLLFRGAIAIGTSIQLKNYQIATWWWPLIFGIATILFSFLMLAHPEIGGLTIVILTALAFISFGVFHIAFAIALNRFRKKFIKPGTENTSHKSLV